MARRRSSSAPPPKRPANLSTEQIRAAIPKLERRLREVMAENIERWGDDVRNKLNALHTKIDQTLVEVFGPDTLDYERYQVREFWYHRPMQLRSSPPPDREFIDAYTKGLSEAETQLRTAIEMLEKQLEDTGETPGGRALQAYQGLDLHPEIERRAGKLYRNGHYANAVEDAVKALNALVRLRSGVEDKDGTSLMEFVFNPNNPILKFNDLKDQSDHNEQKGYMMLFSGSVSGLRNPRAHRFMEDDPERALEFIAFVSLLAKLLDTAKD